MYTENLPKILHSSLLVASSIGASGIKFSKKTKNFYISPISRSMLRGFPLISVAMNIFAVVRTLELFYFKGGHENPYFYMCYIGSFALVMVNSAAIFANWSQNKICRLMNHLYGFGLQFRSK